MTRISWILAALPLIACQEAPPSGGGVPGIVTEVLPMEDEMIGGMDTIIDENGNEQVIYWDGLRSVIPVTVRAADGTPLDEATARAAAVQACLDAGFAGLEETATALSDLGMGETVLSWEFRGCILPEGGA